MITHHKPQIAIFKKECSNIITETTMNSTQNTPIESKDNIQT